MRCEKCKTLAMEVEGRCKETSLWNQGEMGLESLAINMMLGMFQNLFKSWN